MKTTNRLKQVINILFTNEISEILEYAKYIGMDPNEDAEIFYIAKEALKAPLPSPWKPCRRRGVDELFYVNMETGETMFEHPCDEYYK